MESNNSMSMKTFSIISLLVFGALFVLGCRNEPTRLPYLGNIEVNGTDTIYHTVPDIALINQDSQSFRISSIGNKVILADFFFMESLNASNSSLTEERRSCKSSNVSSLFSVR